METIVISSDSEEEQLEQPPPRRAFKAAGTQRRVTVLSQVTHLQGSDF